MKKFKYSTPLLFLLFSFISACATTAASTQHNESSSSNETLYVYEDGRMALNTRYIDDKDVVIYSDGRGGEKAAVKVPVPLHSAFPIDQ